MTDVSATDKPIKVIVVDDSAFIRVLLTQILEQDDAIQVVATAEDPLEAREKIKKYNPDVITLDVEMPKMDGLTFLKNIMRLRPMPVIMISTLTHAGADITIEALNTGAVDFVTKPTVEVKENLNQLAETIVEKVKVAAQCNLRALEDSHSASSEVLNIENISNKFQVIAVGASTGGTEAILSVVKQLPANLPPLVLTQHIPDVFSSSYARRLNKESVINVTEVREPQKLLSGCAYLAPGHQHMKVEKRGKDLWAVLDDGEKVNRHKPAVDVLFHSLVEVTGERTFAMLLTGMGQDGALGLYELRKKGAVTVAQDEASSVVWGMPGAAVRIDAAEQILPLKDIPGYLLKRL